MPETMSPELLLAATRGPQVETLGDAFARMRANQDTAKARKQQLTLGDISTEEGRLKLAQLKQDAQLDQERRQAMRDIAGGGKPPQQDDVPQPGSPQLAPQAPMQAPQGAPAPGMVGVNQGMGAPPQQAAIPQPAPTTQSPFAADEAFIANRRAAGDFRAADAAEQALLKRKLDSAAAEKDSAQAYNDTQTGNKTASGLRNEALLKGTTFLLSLPPEQRAAAWPQVRDSVAQQGHIDRAHLGTLEYPGDQWLSTEHGTLQDQANIDAVAKAKREADLAPSQLAKSKTEADQAAKINAGTSATGMTAEQQATDKRATDALAETKKYHGQEIGMQGAHLALSQKEYQQKYGDAVGNLPPASRAIAEKLAAGEFNPSQLGRMPGKEAIIAGAIAINPAWTQATYDTKQAFTNPDKKQSQNLGTISRIVGHIGRFEANSKDMDVAPGYAMGVNLTGGQAKLNEDAHAISGELEKLVSGGVGSVQQTREWQKALHSPLPGARQQAIDEISQLVGSQYEGMNQTYKTAMGSDIPVEKYISPSGREWMKSKGINVKGMGSIPHVTTKAQFDALPSGATYTEDDGKQYRKP